MYEKPSDTREIKKSLYKFLSNKNTPNKLISHQESCQNSVTSIPARVDHLTDFNESSVITEVLTKINTSVLEEKEISNYQTVIDEKPKK